LARLGYVQRFTLTGGSGKMRAMEPWLVVFVIAVVLVAGTAQTVTGFGFALVAVPFLIIVLEPEQVVVLTSLLALANSGLVAARVLDRVPWRTVARMLAGSLAGMPFGLMVLIFAPDEALRIGVGVASIVMAIALGSGLSFEGRGYRGELIAGATSGVLNTSTSMNGPPVVLYLAGRRLPPDEFRGGLSAYFFISGLISIGAFAASGVFTWMAAALAGFALPAVFAASAIGHALAGRVSQQLFRRLVFALLIATASVAVGTTIARIAM
jgi:uncharacterized membrane protein YfcA